MLTSSDTDTICAIATPPGRSGVGIIRISGPDTRRLARLILHFDPTLRHAHYCTFFDNNSEHIDQGIALFFNGPNSFTGEDVLELQGHGGHFVLDLLLQCVISHGCRLARPGEFTERAFLNNKIDLAQAEAIADLIDSSSQQAARSAMRTLQGEFSRLISNLAESIIDLRVYLEAAIDFTDEEIDFLSEGRIAEKLDAIIQQLRGVTAQATQGALIRDGMSVVIAGKPNAGKSSLLNALAGKDSAIVTDIAGTTRDILSEQINIEGMPLHITDTAGLRDSDDVVEQEGIRRALKAIEQADQVLLMIDSSREQVDNSNLSEYLNTPFFAPLREALARASLTVIQNKIDLAGNEPSLISAQSPGQASVLRISAKNQYGIELLKQHLKDLMGYRPEGEGGFIARRRHLDALNRAEQCLQQAAFQLSHHGAAELVAEDLRHAHRHLGEITGTFTTDDLLGRIFSSFCIGK
jgi:tRNA modification GTPase